jgi:DNA-binding IscR family transcriptional regulator
MLRISRLTDYATVILANLGGGDLASAADIAERTRIGLPTVSKLLKELQHAGLVRSVRALPHPSMRRKSSTRSRDPSR